MRRNPILRGFWRMRLAAGALAGVLALLALPAPGVAPLYAGIAEGAAPEGLKSDFSVSGDRMIWFEVDGNGVKQIHYRNLSTGEERKLTNSPSAKDAPYLFGNTVVWADKGAHAPDSVYWDIYRHNLDTGQTEKLNKRDGEMSNPITDGVGVVWFDRKPYGDMYYRHLASGEEYNLGEGLFPALADGRVVYRNARDGGLSMLDLRTGNRWPLVRLGGANFVDWFVYNGSHVLWKQKNGAGESQYAMLAVGEPSAQPVELTPMTARSREYAYMALGDTQAVFVVDEGGSAALKGVELASGRVYAVNAPAGAEQIAGFSGDRLVFGAADGSVSFVELTGPQGGGPPGGGANPPGTDGGNAGGGDAGGVRKRIGPEGGELVSGDGQARLRFAADTFTKDTETGLERAALESFALADEKGRKLQGYEAWRVSADAAFGRSAELLLGYGSRPEWLAVREMLGIYVYDGERGHWTYVGGVTGDEEGRVRAAIGRPGVYAVLLREVAFPDVRQDHWARHAVDVLAARGIVDGTDKGTFDPAGTLTRAQFAKLLASALGLEADASGPAPFADVPAGAWYAGAVKAAAEAGLVQGDDRGRFHPNGVVTREQMTVMLVRAIERQTGAAADAADLSGFRDAAAVSGWARAAMAKAVGTKLIEGYGDALSPQAAATRAQAAAVIYRLLGQLNQL